jgi:hypothetical protein
MYWIALGTSIVDYFLSFFFEIMALNTNSFGYSSVQFLAYSSCTAEIEKCRSLDICFCRSINRNQCSQAFQEPCFLV